MELYLFGILIFAAAAMCLQALLFHARRRTDINRAVNRRLALTRTLGDQQAVLDALERERGIGKMDWLPSDKLREFWVQSGLRLDTQHMLLYFGGILVGSTLLFWYVLNLGLLAFAIGPTVAIVISALVVAWVRSKRLSRFGEQLPDAVDIIVRSVRAGHPFPVAIGLVAREMPDPIGTEFGMTADEIAYGLDVRSALQNMNHRAGQSDLRFFVVALSIQFQTGGNLAEILARLSKLIRDRFKLKRHIRALSAEGRLSGVFLSLIPFILFGILSLIAPGYYGEIADHPAVPFLLGGGALLLLAGNLIIYKMVNFKF